MNRVLTKVENDILNASDFQKLKLCKEPKMTFVRSIMNRVGKRVCLIYG
ncbi:MAG: hypothetical protein IJT36_06025 [Alphaproteobacteria bacterium]|nr:hypothetical protein [Alphaproteobacteria bacterium]